MRREPAEGIAVPPQLGRNLRHSCRGGRQSRIGIIFELSGDNQTMLLKRKFIERDESLRMPAGTSGKTKKRKIKYAPVTLSEQKGVRFLHFGTEWIQGAMRLRKPNWLELEYSRKMMAWLLFNRNPHTICQLGLGAGSLTKFCYHQFPDAVTVAVELNPDVISVCKSMFALPEEDERLQVLEMDAMDFVNDKNNFGVFDIMHCDLYDATAKGPVLDTPEFYAACRQCLVSDGMMTVNLFGDHPSFERNLSAMRGIFDEVVCLSPTAEGNVIALAFKKRPEPCDDELRIQAEMVKEKFGLPAKKWVKDIRKALVW